MKNRNAKCDYLKQRNANIRRELVKRLGNPAVRLDDIFAEMAMIPVERFYISEERALRLINERRRTGRWPAGMNPRRIEMIQEIEKRVEWMMALDPDLSLPEAVFRVVNSPAPAFYLTPGSLRTIFYTAC